MEADDTAAPRGCGSAAPRGCGSAAPPRPPHTGALTRGSPCRPHLRERGSEVTGAFSLDPALLQTDSGLLVLVPTRDPGAGSGVRQRVLLVTDLGRAQARSPGTPVGRTGVWASQHRQLHPPVGREASYTTLLPGRPEPWGVAQNCYLPGPSPGSLSREAPFAPSPTLDSGRGHGCSTATWRHPRLRTSRLLTP